MKKAHTILLITFFTPYYKAFMVGYYNGGFVLRSADDDSLYGDNSFDLVNIE